MRLDGAERVSGNFGVDRAVTARDQPRNAATTGRANDSREIHVASHRRAGHNDFTLALQGDGRLVPEVLVLSAHGSDLGEFTTKSTKARGRRSL